MKYLLIFLVAFFSVNVDAQFHLDSPMKTYADFGFTKPVTQFKDITYKLDNEEWDPIISITTTFNTSGQLLQEYANFIEELNLKTMLNYVYDGSLLDSINTFVSISQFNVQSDVEMNKNGQVTTSIAEGTHTNYTRTYAYNPDGLLKTITTYHTDGNINRTEFTYKEGELDLVTEANESNSEESEKIYYMYNNGILFASWQSQNNDLGLFPNEFYGFELKNHAQPLETATTLRDLFSKDKKKFDVEIRKLSKKAEAIQEISDSRNKNGDWTKRMVKNVDSKNTEKQFVFREIEYADGSISGSTDFDKSFYKKMKKK